MLKPTRGAKILARSLLPLRKLHMKFSRANKSHEWLSKMSSLLAHIRKLVIQINFLTAISRLLARNRMVTPIT